MGHANLWFHPLQCLTISAKSLASDSMIRKLGMIKFCYQEKELKSPKDKVKSLRLWISTDPELSASLNCNEKLEKVKEILDAGSTWKYAGRLTLLGKITVIKSLVVSQLVYLLSPLRSNYKVLNEINDFRGSQKSVCSFVHFIFNLERRLNFTFLFVLFINSCLVFETILPYCERNTDILDNKCKILLYLTLFCHF